MAAVSSTSSTTTNPYSILNSASTATSSSSSTTATEDPQNRFLKLLVTQLKNQDPLNPLDNAEMTSQLAQMSTVTGIEKLNTTLNTLVDSLGNTEALQSSDIIGKNVLVPGKNMTLSNGAAYAGVKLASAADQVTLKVMNSAGTVIHSQKLGAQDAGVFDVVWDGTTDSGAKATDGTYTFSVEATQGNNAVTVEALQVGTVSALVRSTAGFKLDLGTLGTYEFKDVQQIL